MPAATAPSAPPGASRPRAASGRGFARALLWPVLAIVSGGALAETPAQGYGTPDFVPPEPGSYALPPLGPAGNGMVIDEAGRRLELHELLGDRMVLLSFIYSSCSEVNGCPLATFVLHRVQQALHADPELRDSVRLLSLSFDHERDTPAVMSQYGTRFAVPGMDWRFLTTAGAGELAPLLAAYDQALGRTPADGDASAITHVLRVFLIDRQRRIRNIYSASYLHAELLLADLRTLLLEQHGTAHAAAVQDGSM